MFIVEFFEENPRIVSAHSFELTAGHLIFRNDLGKPIGYFNKDVIKSVFEQEAPTVYAD